MLLRHEFETRSLPCSLAAALAALPSISLIPSARFTNSHQLMRFMRRCFRAQRLFWARWSLNPAGAEKLLGKNFPDLPRSPAWCWSCEIRENSCNSCLSFGDAFGVHKLFGLGSV